MKKLVLITGAMLALCAPAVFAVEQGLDLTWQNCVGEAGPPAALNNVNFNCTANQTFSLFGCFKTDVNLPTWFAMDIIIEFQIPPNPPAPGVPLPQFYHYESPLGCNVLGRGISTDPDPATLGTICTAFNNVSSEGGSGGQASVNGFAPDSKNNVPTPGHGGFSLSVFRSSADPLPLQAKKNYFAFRMTFNSNRRASCAGCGTVATLTHNYSKLTSQDGSVYVIEGPDKKPGRDAAIADINCPNPPCAPTGARNSTWGQLKSLYR